VEDSSVLIASDSQRIWGQELRAHPIYLFYYLLTDNHPVWRWKQGLVAKSYWTNFLLTLTSFSIYHRHLSNIDCLMARTACFVCFISTVNGLRNKEALEDGHITNLKQYILETFNIYAIYVYTEMSMVNTLIKIKVVGVKVYPRQTWNFRSHAVSACSNHVISLWCHSVPWHHRLMHAVTAWAWLFRFRLGYTFTSSYFGSRGSQINTNCAWSNLFTPALVDVYGGYR
jgi:hypothetical protein